MDQRAVPDAREAEVTPDQRKRLNAMCGDLSAQVPWWAKGADGEWHLTLLHKDDWRHMWAGIQLGERVVKHPEEPGRFVTLGASSLRLTVHEAGEVMDRISAFGAERGVQWTDPEWRVQQEQAA